MEIHTTVAAVLNTFKTFGSNEVWEPMCWSFQKTRKEFWCVCVCVWLQRKAVKKLHFNSQTPRGRRGKKITVQKHTQSLKTAWRILKFFPSAKAPLLPSLWAIPHCSSARSLRTSFWRPVHCPSPNLSLLASSSEDRFGAISAEAVTGVAWVEIETITSFVPGCSANQPSRNITIAQCDIHIA